MSQEDGYGITEEEINTSITSISKTNISFQQESDESDEEKTKLKHIMLAKHSDRDGTNHLYLAKQKEIVDVKIKLNYDSVKTIKGIDEIDTELDRFKAICEELKVKRIDTMQIVSQHNVLMKCVEKQLDTKSLIIEQIIPSKIEKQALVINTLSTEYDNIKKEWLEKSQHLQNLLELRMKLMKYDHNYITELSTLENNDPSSQYAEVLLIHKQKISDQYAQKENIKCANVSQVDILKKLMNENVNLYETMTKDINVNEEILNMNIAAQEKFNANNKTLFEKKANYLNTEYCLLPSVQTKKLEGNAVLCSYITAKEDLNSKLDLLHQESIVQATEIDKLEMAITHLDFHNSQEKENLNCNILKLDESLISLNCIKKELQEETEGTNLIMETFTEEVKKFTNSLNEFFIETNDANKRLQELTKNYNSLKDSIFVLENSFNDLCNPEQIDIEEFQKEINLIRTDIDNIKIEIPAKQKLFSNELEKAKSIDLATLRSKLKHSRNEKKHVLLNLGKKIEMRDLLNGRVTKVELIIQELLGSFKNNYKSAQIMAAQSPKADMGILKRLGEKSPAKRVHFAASLASMSSQCTEDSAESRVSDLIGKLAHPLDKSSIEAPNSPPTRLYAKKGKYCV